MMNYVDVPIGTIVPFIFDTFAGATGASITLTGFALADVRIIKDANTTIKTTPTAGLALIDTDGIDIGLGTTMTGIHGFTINTGNTTDAGYFAIGSYYTIIVDAVTIDTQTVRFIVGKFRLVPAETVAGYRKVDAAYVGGSTAQTAAEVATAVELELGTGSSFTALAQATNLASTNTAVNAIKTKTDFLPSATAGASGGVAIVGSAMGITLGTDSISAAAMSAGAVTKIANGHLDLTDGIETGLTPRQLGRLNAAANAGVTTGMDTGTGNFRNIANTKNRIQASLDGNNRTAITLDLT